MYQQIYNYGHSPQQQQQQHHQQQLHHEEHDNSNEMKNESMFYNHDNSQQQYQPSLNGNFSLRYPSFDPNAFDQSSQHHQQQQQQQQQQHDVRYGQPHSGRNDSHSSIHAFNSFQSMSSPQDILTNTSVGYNSVDLGSNASSSTITATVLPPLNTTPIIMTQLQHHHTTSHQTYLLAQKKPLKGSPRPSRERAPWTPEEDNLLKLAVQLYGDKTEKWAKIAACVPGRTNKNCRKRWFHSLDPSLRKGAWTEEEDQLLREGVSKYPNQWSKIADMLPGRTDDQCAKRWRESLDPSIDRSEWTTLEDALLMEKYEEYGSQWQKIAFFFDGRPGLHCRNRWRKLQRMVQIKKDKEGATMNAPFFNTLAEDQNVRFQHNSNNSNNNELNTPHNNNISNTYTMTDNSNSNNTNNINNNNNTVHSHHNNNTNNIQHHHNTNDASHSYHQLTTLLSQQQQQQHHHHHNNDPLQQPQQQHDPSVLVQFSNPPNTSNEENDEYENGVKPFGCDVPGCFAVFAASTGLFYHMKNIHPNLEGVEKPYRCAMMNCSKKYKNINGLQYHIKDAKGTTGHGGGNGLGDDDRPYRCMIASCKKAYRTASGFRYHQQNGHNIQPNMQQHQQHLLPQQLQPQQHHEQQQLRMKREKWVMEGV